MFIKTEYSYTTVHVLDNASHYIVLDVVVGQEWSRTTFQVVRSIEVAISPATVSIKLIYLAVSASLL